MADIQSIYRTEINNIKTYEFGANNNEDESDKAMSASTKKPGMMVIVGFVANMATRLRTA